MIRFFRGWLEVEIAGADPVRVMNLFAKHSLAFWRPERKGELYISCRIFRKDFCAAEQMAVSAMCTLRVMREHGFQHIFGGLRRRHVLLVGTVIAMLAAMFLQNFVWTVEIEGNRSIPTQLLRQELEAVGVRFGAWGPSFRPLMQRFELQNRVDQIAWIAVNRRGGRVTVSLTERAPEGEITDRRLFTDLIASRPGILTSVDVYNGFSEVEPGDAVVTGQVLVSGMADWQTHIQLTRSLGEIYAQTLHQQAVCLPAVTGKKHYTGRTYCQMTLVLGKKRIKIFGNSGISYPGCDKMTYRSVCALPGGYDLPLVLEKTVCKEYTLETTKLSEAEAEKRLAAYVQDYVKAQMLAGRILSSSQSFRTENGAYRLDASVSCEEMIARTVPGVMKEVTDGTDDQCGAD